MIIIIVEDEPVISERIERFVREILDKRITRLKRFESLEEATSYITNHPIDLLFLDLNLKGKDGFELLKLKESESFYTIIISAYDEKAIQAFKHSVITFLEKPFSKEDIEEALKKVESFDKKNKYSTRFLSTKFNGEIQLIEIESIKYIKGAGIYSEIIFEDNTTQLFHQNIEKTNRMLPENFIRIHKSFIINIYHATSFITHGASKYSVRLKSAEELPVSRQLYKEIKALFEVK